MEKAINDIVERRDVETFVAGFYEKVKKDPLLGPVFSEVDWPRHLPIMYNFWSSMLLGERTYQGNPLQRHMHLAIGPEHFTRWLQLFNETIDETFHGEKAEEVKMRAHSIAGVFQHKMGLRPTN